MIKIVIENYSYDVQILKVQFLKHSTFLHRFVLFLQYLKFFEIR